MSTEPKRTSWMDRLSAAFGRGRQRPQATHEFEGTISIVDPSRSPSSPQLSPVVTQVETCAHCGQPRNASVHLAFPPDEDSY